MELVRLLDVKYPHSNLVARLEAGKLHGDHGNQLQEMNRGSTGILGVVMARNEWPLLALSVSHALTHLVDHVFVLDHSSGDASATGLAMLEDHWRDRLTVRRLAGDFFHGAALNLLVEEARHTPHDWIYGFDADEFGLPGRTPLRDLLAALAPSTSVVRYRVRNWVSFHDFDDRNPDHYRRLRYRAVTRDDLDISPDDASEEIAAGRLSYFDLKFGTKIIVRRDALMSVGTGFHNVDWPRDLPTLTVGPEEFSAAHFPLLSRRRLAQRADHGRELEKQGVARVYSWQSRLVLRLKREGRLGAFWRSHSLHHGEEPARATPTYVEDTAFVNALGELSPALLAAITAINPRRDAPSSGPQPEDTVPMSVAVQAIQRQRQMNQSLLEELKQRDSGRGARKKGPTACDRSSRTQ